MSFVTGLLGVHSAINLRFSALSNLNTARESLLFGSATGPSGDTFVPSSQQTESTLAYNQALYAATTTLQQAEQKRLGQEIKFGFANFYV
jgi:hypothetical protein